MKKATIILTCVAILAVAGGTFAFKANRLPGNVYTLLPFYKTTSITVGGIVYTTTIPNCTLNGQVTTAFGPPEHVSSTTTDPISVTYFRSAGHPDYMTTFAYCAPWTTRVILAND